jgi:hypothetical protein
MSTAPNGQTRTGGTRRRLVLGVVVGLLLAGLVFLVLAPVVPWRVERGWTCATCGARRRLTEHMLWGERGPRRGSESRTIDHDDTAGVTPGPLTLWLAERGLLHEHRWVKTMDTTYSLLGQPGLRSHAVAPPVYKLLPEAARHLVNTASEESILRFLEQLRRGGPKAEAAVAGVNEDWLKAATAGG